MQFKPSSILKIVYAGFLIHVYYYILYSVLSLTFLKMAAWNMCKEDHNMTSFSVWLQVQYVYLIGQASHY